MKPRAPLPRRPGPALALTLALAASASAGCAGDGSSPAASTAGLEPDEVLADSLIGAWVDAAGGMAAWENIESARYTITTVWYDSVGEIRRMRPRRVEYRKVDGVEQTRIERPEAEGLYVQTFTGSDMWATLNERLLEPGIRAWDESEYVGRDVVYWFGLPYKLFDPGVNRRAGPWEDGGYEVRITFGDGVGLQSGDRYFYYFLDDDPYPEQVHYISQGRGEESRARMYWDGYEEVGDFTYVISRLYRDTEMNPTRELRHDDVELNPALPDSIFQRPAF
ncbi:hypothetical protein [Candidatus Palauibacter sp.]|uniref:hypothetical protein n=1 Tax=Candidatus Palauibacter sp. TaxID=3101350 RepID=UPI003AF2DF3C